MLNERVLADAIREAHKARGCWLTDERAYEDAGAAVMALVVADRLALTTQIRKQALADAIATVEAVPTDPGTREETGEPHLMSAAQFKWRVLAALPGLAPTSEQPDK